MIAAGSVALQREGSPVARHCSVRSVRREIGFAGTVRLRYYSNFAYFLEKINSFYYYAFMTRISEIKKYVGNLAREFHPERVILFGSYAHGKPTKDSDVDILVIMKHDKSKNVEQAIAIDRRVDYSFPLDLLVRKPDEVKRRIALHDAFLLVVLKEGKVLYERRN